MSKKHTKMNLDFDIKFSDIDDSDHDSGFAKANVITRVYSKPVKFNNYDYDLTKNIFKKTKSGKK